MFENVNRRTDDGRTDGRRRTPDPWVSYKLTGEPSAQVSYKKSTFYKPFYSFIVSLESEISKTGFLAQILSLYF